LAKHAIEDETNRLERFHKRPLKGYYWRVAGSANLSEGINLHQRRSKQSRFTEIYLRVSAMKKFIIYWFCTVLTILIVPSLLAASSAMNFMSDGAFGSSDLHLVGAGAFVTTMFVIGYIGFVPALVVLLIGMFICRAKSV
jgi:hypothetical protein